MKKILKIIGVYFMTIFVILIVNVLSLLLLSSMRDSYISNYDIFFVSVASLVGLIGACTYILYTKK